MKKKTRKITGILIDAENQDIREVTIDKSLDGYYGAVNCDTITCVPYDRFNDVIVDDEGLLKQPQFFFEYKEFEIAGNGFVVGLLINSGDWTDTKLTAEEVKKHVRFFSFINVNNNLIKVYYN